MSRFFSVRHNNLKAYTPGEQPKDMKYIKLNTNESPFPPPDSVAEAAADQARLAELYSDPECTLLREKMSEVYGVPAENIVMGNGSDEILALIFSAFGDENSPFVFPDITYSFYKVFADLYHVPYTEIPLDDSLMVHTEDYENIGKNIVIANPNAPTGQALSAEDIERIVCSNRNNIVVIDEAYVDFGAVSSVTLTQKYDNLIVCGTFSKSRSMAGARLGFAIADRDIIKDLNTMRYSTNPYNVNRMTMAAGIAALSERDYFLKNCRDITETRKYTEEHLLRLGFSVLPSRANFLFIKSDKIGGKRLYEKLKEAGILVRHFDSERIKEYIRVTIGTRDQMKIFLDETEKILGEES